MPLMCSSIKRGSIQRGSIEVRAFEPGGGAVRPFWRPVLRGLAWAVVLVTAPLVHLALATGRYSALALGFAAVQLAIGVGLTLGRWNRAGWGVAACLPGAALLAAPWLLRAPAALLRMQAGLSHGLLYGGLLVMFANSLRRGHTPLITALASRMTGDISPRRAAYTRHVTQAWCAYCAAQLAGSVLLAAFAPVAVWSFFVNVLDFPLLCLMFGAEYALRRRIFRDQPHASLRDGLRAFAARNSRAG